MGRPKQHDERTALALLECAERVIATDGVEAVSIRKVAAEAGTTTRAVYSLFGSKEGLLLALGVRAFDWLDDSLRQLKETSNPAEDLIEAGVRVFRTFAISHPVLYRIGFQQGGTKSGSALEEARLRSFARLEAKIKRLESNGTLGGRTVFQASCYFSAMCEGLAEMELRGAIPRRRVAVFWHDSLATVVHGLSLPAANTMKRNRRGSKR